MNWKYFIGVDVSKATLDVCVLNGREKNKSFEIENKPTALAAFWKVLAKQIPDLSKENAVFCMEHTGIYNEHILSFLHKKNAAICLEHPAHLKLSVGLTRGKNDKVDAERIAVYAYKERESIRMWEPPRAIIKKLKQLTTLRNRLVRTKKALTVPVKEIKSFDRAGGRAIEEICKGTLRHIAKDLEAVEKLILDTIKSDPNLKRLFQISTSISGIGTVTAIEIIISTNEFKNIRNPKKFACYAGIVPFEHYSGTSLRGRPRVSHKANKRVKALLHMAAMASLISGDMKRYFERKNKEGKNKMSIINAVRNKLIQRLFSCIREDRLYTRTDQRQFA
ncbi:MAG: IS110 family transposase [Bacteroidota bacterium]